MTALSTKLNWCSGEPEIFPVEANASSSERLCSGWPSSRYMFQHVSELESQPSSSCSGEDLQRKWLRDAHVLHWQR